MILHKPKLYWGSTKDEQQGAHTVTSHHWQQTQDHGDAVASEPSRNTWSSIVWQQQPVLHRPFGRGDSCAVPWLCWSSGRSKAHLTSTVLPTLLLPSWAQGAGSLSIPPLALVRGRASASAFVPVLAMGQGGSRQSVIGHCLVTAQTLWSGLLLYLAQISLFESLVLS